MSFGSLEEKASNVTSRKEDFERGATNPEVVNKQLFFELYNRASDDDEHTNDHQILQKHAYMGLEEAKSVKRIFDGQIPDVIATPRFTKENQLLQDQRKNVGAQQKEIFKNILEFEPFFQMQESRKQIAERNLEPEEKLANVLQVEADDYFNKGLEMQQISSHTRDLLKSFQIYKDHVEKSVPYWDREATTVEGVCGRFRDLLTLRCELMQEVDQLLQQLHQARMKQLEVDREEKIAEGKSLLHLYSNRNHKWESKKKMDEAENRFRVLQSQSTETITNLTRVRLALSNMYCVARTYQKSLTPLTPQTPSNVVLKRLHNFLQDASTVTREAEFATGPNSIVAAKGSDPV